MTLIREFELDGFKCELYTGGWIYPKFNGNDEFKATSMGYKKLRKYLRMVKSLYDLRR